MNNLSPHDYVIAEKVINVFSGNSSLENLNTSEQEILDTELEMFVSLASTSATMARIEHMLKTGKNLNN
jgi:3-hydroxyacyl-CoA dehydrogenase